MMESAARLILTGWIKGGFSKEKVFEMKLDVSRSCILCSVASILFDSFCDPLDYSLPGFSVRGISQARIIERVANSYFRGSSQLNLRLLHLWHWQMGSLPVYHLGGPEVLTAQNLQDQTKAFQGCSWGEESLFPKFAKCLKSGFSSCKTKQNTSQCVS